jgi:hypothetical protein
MQGYYKKKLKNLLEQYSQPLSLNEKGKTEYYEGIFFEIDIDRKKVPLCISQYCSISVGNLSVSTFSISTVWNTVLQEQDKKILEFAGIDTQSIRLGYQLDISKPSYVRKLIHYFLAKIEENGYKVIPIEKEK